MNYQIFDIGGTFLKIYNSKDKIIKRFPMEDEKILSLKNIKKIILENIRDDTEYIGISSQMHGFILFDEDNNNISEFITWKSSSNENILNEDIFNNFYLTGLKKRNDLPINNLSEYLLNNINNIKNKKIFFKNITEGILDVSYNKTHITMACGSGFYDIFNNKYIKEYIEYFNNKYNIDLLFDNVINSKDISGYIIKNNKKILVYSGLGDFQASLYGSISNNNFLLINMATGSQVAKIVSIDEIKNIEISNLSYRPYFNNLYIQCITHIPSGRFLNIFSNFFKELNFNMWDYLNTLTIDDIYSSNLNIETNIFNQNGISISNIKEDITIKNMISSILYNYIKQYLYIIKNNNFSYDYIILSGGIPKKINIIKNIFERELEKKIILNDIDDDSILGVINFINK